MPRIRTLKPEINQSPQVMNLSRDARMLFCLGLILQADDEGRGIADPRKLKAAVFPGDDDITSTRVLELLAEVESQGLCITYDANGHGRVYALPSWRSHQYVEKAKKSNYPQPPALPHSEVKKDDSPTHPLHVPASSPTIPRGSDLKEGSEGSSRARVRVRTARGANGTKSPDELKADARKLSAAGTGAGDIVKILAQYQVTEDQVREWIA